MLNYQRVQHDTSHESVDVPFYCIGKWVSITTVATVIRKINSGCYGKEKSIKTNNNYGSYGSIYWISVTPILDPFPEKSQVILGTWLVGYAGYAFSGGFPSGFFEGV